MAIHTRSILIALVSASMFSTAVPAQQSAPGAESPQNVLAAQIRLQGFPCDRPVGAKRDSKRSKPDYAVWVLTCSNGTYRVGRAPDMSASVERLK